MFGVCNVKSCLKFYFFVIPRLYFALPVVDPSHDKEAAAYVKLVF